jgi:hypothetical protein
MRSRRGFLVIGALVALVAVGAGCDDQGSSSDDTPGGGTTTSGTLPFDSPSKDELADATGLSFPASIAGYQSVQLSPGQLDVTFTLAAADVEGFVADSDLPEPTEGDRTLAHASPLWELNPTDTFAGTEATRDGVTIAVEIVGSGDPRTARVSVTTAATP